MSGEALISATAHMDQVTAAMGWAQTLFPDNAVIIDNAQVERVVLMTLAATAAQRGDAASPSLLLHPTTRRVVPVGPEQDVRELIRATAPQDNYCGYCGQNGWPLLGVLPVVAPPQVVCLPLCPACAGLLDRHYPDAEFVWFDPAATDPEVPQP